MDLSAPAFFQFQWWCVYASLSGGDGSWTQAMLLLATLLTTRLITPLTLLLTMLLITSAAAHLLGCSARTWQWLPRVGMRWTFGVPPRVASVPHQTIIEYCVRR
jgi:hypothetical protein